MEEHRPIVLTCVYPLKRETIVAWMASTGTDADPHEQLKSVDFEILLTYSMHCFFLDI